MVLAHNVLRLNIPAWAMSKTERLLPCYCVKNRIVLAAAGKEEEEKEKQAAKRKEQHSVRRLLWTTWSMFSFAEVSGCMSPKLLLCYALFIYFPHTGITHSSVSWSVACSVCLGNVHIFVLTAASWIMSFSFLFFCEGGSRHRGKIVHHVKAGG